MSDIIKQRVTAEIDDEVVVFLIGMRINRLWKIHKWLPVVIAMGRMQAELGADPEIGMLGIGNWFGRTTLSLQYWRSFEALESYSRNPKQSHLSAWKAFNKAIGSNGDVGIWHETYRIPKGAYECVYNNMPAFGLAGATRVVPVGGRLETAAGRLEAQG